MFEDAIKIRTGTVTTNAIYKDQEEMIEEALSAIRRTGTAAALEKCRRVVDPQPEEVNSEHFADTSAVSDLRAFLGRVERSPTKFVEPASLWSRDFLFEHVDGAFKRHLKVSQGQEVDELIRLLVEEVGLDLARKRATPIERSLRPGLLNRG